MLDFGIDFSMYILSLWKVYIAYSYYAVNEISFLYANTIVLFATLTSYFISFMIFPFTKRIKFLIRFKESKSYTKAQHVYSKYGYYPSMLLAPVLLGIPTIALISLTLKQNQLKTLLGLLVSSLLWGSVIYISIYYSFKIF